MGTGTHPIVAHDGSIETKICTDECVKLFPNNHVKGDVNDPAIIHEDVPGQRPRAEPIAIIGMGMRLPGGVHDSASFWDMLVNRRDGRCQVPANRYNVDTWYGPGRPLHVGTREGNFLQDYNPAHIDTSFWSMSKEEAETMDPEQRLLLEVVYEAFESSGRRDFRGDEVGVYVGTMGSDWDKIELQDSQNLDPVRADIYGDYVLANRVSYEFDLKGPSIVLRTACSSSLSALHMACQDIRSGECTSAMVCGTNLILTPRDTTIMTEQGVLSGAGVSRSFDADADGYGRGEAVNAILVKRLSEAIRDGDPIRAVIRNTCISGDGRTRGLTVPNPASHEKLIRRAYRAAGINDLSTVAMVECHGTGTAVGDPIEIEAIAAVWGETGINIGSVKPNIGHGEGASALSSIIKMVLALENATIPPNIHFATPNPKIPWTEARLTVPIEARPWPSDRLERVSVQSFGIGGANATVILESAKCAGAAQHCNADPPPHDPSRRYLLPVSATSQQSLIRRVKDLKLYLKRNLDSLGDVAYSLAARRESHLYGAFATIGKNEELAVDQMSIRKVAGDPPSLVWVFTGQGAQWAQMGKELIENVPFVQRRLQELQEVLDSLADPPAWSLKDAMLAPRGESRLYEAEYSQPCLAALQIVLVDLLRSWNISPAAIVGHSSGETAGGYAAGVISAKDAMTLAYHRGQITPPLKAAHHGGMAAVGMGKLEVERYLQPGVIVGCENSPSSVSLSGEKDVLERVMAHIKEERPDVLCRALQVECGYHSQHMYAIRDNFDTRVAGISDSNPPQVPFYSSVTGHLNKEFSRKYWSTNMISPVLFSTAVESLLRDYPKVTFIELGPHSALSGPLRQILQKHNRSAEYIPTLIRNLNGHASVLRAAGELWVQGFSLDLETANRPGRFLTDLPTYPWHYETEYWVESRLSRDWRFRRFDHHELLGVRVLETGDALPSWRCKLRVHDVPWLRDHTFRGDILFPATAYIAMAGEAIRQLTSSKDFSVRKVDFLSPLILGDEMVEIITALAPSKGSPYNASPWFEFFISALHGEGSTRLVAGQCRAGSTSTMTTPVEGPVLPRRMSPESLYYTCQRHGLNYGPKFRGLTDIRSGIAENRATGLIPDLIPAGEMVSPYAVHPTALDSSLHICMVSACRALERNFTIASVPKSIEEMYVSDMEPGSIQVDGQTRDTAHGGAIADVTGVCNGKISFNLRGLEVAPFNSDSMVDEDPHAGAILEWKADIDFINTPHLFGLAPKNNQTRTHTNGLPVCEAPANNEIQDPNTEVSRNELDLAVFLSLLGHQQPNMRILQVGAGDGILTSKVLARLKSNHKDRIYGQFTVTDATPEAIRKTRERFEAIPAFNVTIMDLAKDPLAQGFRAGAYDLIIVNDVICNNASHFSSQLQSCHSLLQPRGWLIMQQTHASPNSQHSEDNGANGLKLADSANLDSTGVLLEALKTSGFDSTTAFIHPSAGMNFAIARPAAEVIAMQKVTVLCRDSTHTLITSLTDYLASHGIEPSFLMVGEELPSGQPILSLLDLEKPFLHDISPDMFVAFKTSVLSMQDSSMLWVTAACQVDCQKPNYALGIGALRTIRNETSCDIVTLELERFDDEAWTAVLRLLQTLPRRPHGNESKSFDTEYAFSQGQIKMSRFHQARVADQLTQQPTRPESLTFTLDYKGSQDDPWWKACKDAAVQADKVGIEVKAFELTTIASSVFTGTGIVRQLGPDTRGFEEGDKVVFFCAAPAAALMVLHSSLCHRLPKETHTLEEAVIPTALICALHALEGAARLAKGQTVLVHSTSKGKGWAAVRLAKLLGAEVYCTAEARDAGYIANTCGLPQNHVLVTETSSSACAFLDGNKLGEGFDVVLDYIHDYDGLKAWDLVAPFGTYVDMSENDSSKAGQYAFIPGCSRTFIRVDFMQLLLYRPQVCQRLLSRGFSLHQGDRIKVFEQYRTFDATHIKDAVTYLRDESSRRLGTVLITIPKDAGTKLEAAPSRLQTQLRPERTYVFVGGLGGLGQAIARFLVEKGARYIIFFSRSAESTAEIHADYIKELEFQGCDVQAISGDVSELSDVRSMLAAAKRPIAGILHAAMVLQDVNLSDMTFAQWQKTIRPKVRGTWNLHNALQLPTEPLDFFFLFSSISGLGGQVGQANYAAGNAFLDAFVQYRQSLGLPCSVLDIGMMRGVGILAKETYRLEAMRAESLHALHEQELLDALELMLARSYPSEGTDDHSLTSGYVSSSQMAIGLRFSEKSSPSMSQASWQRDPRTLAIQNTTNPSHTDDDAEATRSSLRQFLQACNANPARLEEASASLYLAEEIGAALSAFRMREGEELDLDASLQAVGVDSLLSIELRNWFRQKVGVVFRIPELRGAASVKGLGAMAARKLGERLQRD